MKLLFIDTNTVEGKYFGSVGEASGAPEFINLDHVMWGTVYRGSRMLALTMVNGATWQLTYPDNKAIADAAKHFFLSKHMPGET